MLRQLPLYLLLLALSLLTQALAAESTAGKRLALVIGNADYPASPLRNPVNDATAMARTLRKLGFEVMDGTDMTHRQMMALLDNFGEKIRKADIALFYYAGHGMQLDGQNYLIPIDADLRSEQEARYKAVNAGLLLAKMEVADARINLMILDACRNNPFARSFRSSQQGLAQMDAPSGTLIAYATAPGQVASDGAGSNGLYTEALLKHLDQPGLKVEDVFKRVRIEVREATGGEQTPWESSSLVGDFYFQPTIVTIVQQPNPASAPAASGNPQAVELSFWESVRNTDNPALLQTYLKRYPDGLFAELARIKLDSLQAKATPAPAPAPQPATPAPARSRDTELTETLLGLWEGDYTTPEGVYLHGRTQYLTGGVWNHSGIIEFQGQRLPLILSGRWEIKNGYRHYTVQSSNMPQFIPNGFASADQILSLDEDEFVYLSNGEEFTEFRTDADTPLALPPQAQQPYPGMGGFCCDSYGYQRCPLIAPLPVGGSCFCPGQGYGMACP